MARTWLVITVELVGGGGRDDLWPRPARTFVAARSHSFEQLAEAIDDAFGRWDLAHLHEFPRADGTSIGEPDPDWDEDRELVDSRQTKLSRLALGEQFAYVFDLGDHWAHLCTVGPERAEPVTAYGSFLLAPPPSSAGVTCLTSTAGAGEATTASHRCHPTRRGATCRPSFPAGADASS